MTQPKFATDATARAQAAEAQSQVLGDQLRRISEQHSVAVKALELLNSTLVDNQKTIGGLQDANLKLTTQVQVEQTARIAADNYSLASRTKRPMWLVENSQHVTSDWSSGTE